MNESFQITVCCHFFSLVLDCHDVSRPPKFKIAIVKHRKPSSSGHDDDVTCQAAFSMLLAFFANLRFPVLLPRQIYFHSQGSVRDPPLIKPLQVSPLLVISLHSKHDGSEYPEERYHHNVQHTINRPLNSLVFPC